MPALFGSDFWNHRYQSDDNYVFGTTPNDFLVECTPHLPLGPVLCLAEGEGRNAVHLARHGYDVTAVDQSSIGLQKARDLAAKDGVSITTTLADLADFEITPSTWSAIVSIFCHLPSPLRQAVHTRAAAGLIPGGMIVLEAYSPAQVNFKTGGPLAAPELLMSLETVRQEFPGIEWDIARSIEREVIEGSGHTGLAAVTQLRGRRSL